MTDERDPRFTDSNSGTDDSGSGRRSSMSGAASRTASGRFPSITPGRGGGAQGRFAQSSMPNVPRAASSSSASMPEVPSAGGRGSFVRGGRPSINRGGRPSVHSNTEVPAHVVADELEPVAEEVIPIVADDLMAEESVAEAHAVEEHASEDHIDEEHAGAEAISLGMMDFDIEDELAALDPVQAPEEAASVEPVEEFHEADIDLSVEPEVEVAAEAEVEQGEAEAAIGIASSPFDDFMEEVADEAEKAVEEIVVPDEAAEAVIEEPSVDVEMEVHEAPEAVEVAVSEPDDDSDDEEVVAEEDDSLEEYVDDSDKGPAFEIKPIPAELRSEASLRDNAAYRKESRSLLRSMNWDELAQLMENVLQYVVWADLPEVRSSILKELAGVYGDRLNNKEKERQTYEQLLKEDPSNESALNYMENVLREAGDFKAIHSMYRHVVDAVWESDERLFYTQKAADIAEGQLNKPALVVADWEHLWELGDHGKEVQSAMMTAYREHACWEKLAAFVRENSVDWGQVQQLGLREVIEIYISGLGDAERASETLNVLLKDRPTDPLLLLQEINICRLNGDIDKLAKLSQMRGLDKTVELNIHRAAAEVLWDKGEYELAVDAYDAILQELPEDRDALHAKEQYFIQSERNEQLCDFYTGRAEAALAKGDINTATEMYTKSADVAEKKIFDNELAIRTLKKIVELDPNNTDTHRRIISLYEAIGDDNGVATSMEALLALTSRPATRRELLAKLGGLYLDKLENFERAEDCWKKVQAIDPRNPAVSEELSRVYAKQGDFEALDNSLTQQIRVADAENILQLALSKGRYLMQHSPESAHTAAGWEIVLDCDPNHKDSLESLSNVLEKLHRDSEMLGAWEQELRTIDDMDERVSLGLRIADACVDCATHTQAIAAYLRVLSWEPTNEPALAAIEAHCSESERCIAISVLERAAAATEDKAKRCQLLKRTLRFIPNDKVMQRIHVMRRMIILGDEAIVNDYVEQCRSTQHSQELCATWLRRAYESNDLAERDRLLTEVARFNVEDLDNSSLAFTILFASALDCEKATVLAEELEKLAPQTNRWEEVVAVLGCLTSPQFSEEKRREALNKRIDILLNKLDNPVRALNDYSRLLEMDPTDSDLLSVIERLASEKGLHEQMLGVYGELWDLTDNTTLRSEIAEKRHAIQKNALSREYEALTELFIGYRLMPTSEVEAKLVEETYNEAHAPLCVAMLESEKRVIDQSNIDGLKAVANLYENRLQSIDGAFALYASVLTCTPNDELSLEKLTSWSMDDSRKGRYAQTLRLAASRAHKDENHETSLSLYRRLADFYKDALGDVERSVDVERTILHIQPDNIQSLESLIAWHEARNEWPQLRSELKQRIAAGGTVEEKINLWKRVVQISNEHLNDLESAFDGYAEILQLDESNEVARQGIDTLTGADIGPEVELRRLRLELKLASAEKRPQTMLAIAELQNLQLSQPDAACETLENLYKETGPCGIGYEPLRVSYQRLKVWPNLVQIMLEHADALIDDRDNANAINTLHEALTIVDEKLKDETISASIIDKLQRLEPENNEVIDRYCASLRNAEDWPKYANTIKELAGDPNSRSVHKSHLFELARIQALALNDIDGAIETYRSINKNGSIEKNAYFGLASLALKKNDVDLYLNALDLVLHQVVPEWGAIFYCHMAEVCDEKDRAAQVANYYRNARMLDANNPEASDSLRSIGRRLKNWRTSSALLPIEGERELSWSERSKKLVEKAKEAEAVDEKRIWLWKAIAVDHDNIKAWKELAKLEDKAGNAKGRYEAALGAYGAVERTMLPGPAVALENAKLFYEVANAAQACGNEARAEVMLRKAYTTAPEYAPVAIAVGELEQNAGNIEKAYAIYDAILKDEKAKLDNKTKSELLFKRGLISNLQQKYDSALDDLRTTVKMSPLHFEALTAISKTYQELNQPLLALSCMQRSLIVTADNTKRRGNIYYDMGKLWGDVFNDPDEAGIYYEGALNNGASNVDLIERSLEVYKQAGRYKEALDLVETLTKTTTNPAILASLWCTRGELSESISTESATEAYDMALSYQPGMARAFDGLERMLVARQEWVQLADLLDGRLEGELTKEQEAAILVRLADLYSNQLDEPQKASDILYRLLESAPSNDVVQRLLKLPQDNEDKKRMLLEKAILYCDGAYQYALQLAQYHLEAGRELQAWAIMSPLRTLLQLDAQTKDILNDLKNKFEKTESISLDSLSKALPVLSDQQFALLDAIQTVHAKLGTLGAKALSEVTSGATEVAETTPNGKIFHQMRNGLGLESVTLWRSTDLPEAIVVINSNPVVVCIRTEIFQKAAGNELLFWLAKSIGLAHTDVRILASTPEKYRYVYPKAILAAVGITPVTPETNELVSKIKAAFSSDELHALAAQLSICTKEQLIECANTLTNDMLVSSDILASYMVADMRTVWRAESRIDANITEQRNVKTIEEISKAIEVSDILRKALAYYVSSTFTEHIEHLG